MVPEADTMVKYCNKVPGKTKPTRMKYGGTDVRDKAGPGLDIRFEPRCLTSYSGPLVLRHLFSRLDVGGRPSGCFRHPGSDPIYARHVVMMLPVAHPIIGCRRLRDTASQPG